MTFGDRLREARLQKGLTQEQLARQIGVAKSTLTGYEKGNREPDVFKIKRILEILDIDSDYLLGVSRKSSIDSTIPTDEQIDLLNKISNIDEADKDLLERIIDVILETRSKKKKK